ncbi:MAG: ABC transporter ATP-binding protein [Anaerolineae bacterium]|nr:ABC transporter ATP-binding protein [Anaerolineae bacterium]
MKLEVQNVSYAYTPGSPVLEDVSFTLHPGEILYLLGHNGSGKTTLLSCITGVFEPAHGQALLDGVNVRAYTPAERARRIGLVPQIHVPAFPYSVREMVVMGRAPHLGLFGSPGRHDYAIADDALARIGMARFADRPYTELSGGERQLVMVARGLAQQSRVLLLDEPDAHLDPKNQHAVLEMVVELARTQDLAFIISSHAPNNALLYADRVLLLKGGRTLALGGVVEVLTAPLLTTAYEMETEVIYDHLDGNGAVPRAILPRRR